jgi:DNA-directed RNA polymerase subunit RPC12/RpoP
MARSHRDAYAKAIDKVREQHSASMAPAQTPVECPKCGTKQIISDTPGRRICIRCGFEFRPQTQKV